MSKRRKVRPGRGPIGRAMFGHLSMPYYSMIMFGLLVLCFDPKDTGIPTLALFFILLPVGWIFGKIVEHRPW